MDAPASLQAWVLGTYTKSSVHTGTIMTPLGRILNYLKC